MTLSYLKNMPIYFSSGKYKLSIHSFIATKYLPPNPMAIFGATAKDDWWRMIEICSFFSPELDNVSSLSLLITQSFQYPF